MNQSAKPERVPATIETIYLTPTPEIDRQAPPMANQVRVYGTLDSLTLNLYYISPNLVLRAA